MTPQLFERAGRAAFGPDWKSPMARALGVRYPLVHDMATGRYRIPPGVALDVAAILRRVADRADAIEAEISAASEGR
jgi:DNA-binding transcriptional regulator YdaS (Cro superfamily)